MTDRTHVWVEQVNFDWSDQGGEIVIKCKGNFTAVAAAAHEICQAMVRGNNPWWFQRIEADLSSEAIEIDEMVWDITAKFGV